jgi:hypothetical protein
MRFSPSRRAALGFFGAASAAFVARDAIALDNFPPVTVTRDPDCGCCSGWADHLRKAGYPIRLQDTRDLKVVKERLKVPSDLASCHTAEVGGYVIEGHVPVDAIKRLLRDTPTAIGLAVPGMPIGSPGMEGGIPETYEVVLFSAIGRSSFGRYRGDREVTV